MPPDDAHYATRREAPCAAVKQGHAVDLRIILDQASVEVFADEGRVVITEQILPPAGAVATAFYAVSGHARVEALSVGALT